MHVFKKIISCCLLLLCLSPFAFATTTESTDSSDGTLSFDYEPYTAEEFPSWSRKLRRGESLFFGSLAFTFPTVTLGYTAGISAGVFTDPDDDLIQLRNEAICAASIALVIALADYVLGEI